MANQSGSADGTGSNARFFAPQGVVADSASNVYVADTPNHIIRKITSFGVVTTLAGLANQSGGADGTGSNARFFAPQGVAADSAGNVYVADTPNHIIRKITSFGVVTTLAGLANQSGSADGTGSNASFFAPQGVAADSGGNVYLADTNNMTIRIGESTATPTPTPEPVTRFANISTRGVVQTEDNVLIGGFIITGTQSKKVIVRAIGPSLPVAGNLANPTLYLYNSNGLLLASNDNWRDTQEAEIIATIPPTNGFESAIVATLAANSAGYTVIVRGVNNTTGIGLVEVYDLDSTVDSKLANISTRGFVQTGDKVMIGGIIVSGTAPTKALVRAIGPSLPVAGALADPMLELHDGNGAIIASNDNWKDTQQSEIEATAIPPTNDAESAIVETLAPGSITAIVRGNNDTTGIALVEAYQLGN